MGETVMIVPIIGGDERVGSDPGGSPRRRVFR